MASIKAEITTGRMKSFLADPFSAGDRLYSDVISERKALELRVQGKKDAWVNRYKGMTTLGYAAVANGVKEVGMLPPQEARGLNEIIRGLKDREPELIKPSPNNYFTLLDDIGRKKPSKRFAGGVKGPRSSKGRGSTRSRMDLAACCRQQEIYQGNLCGRS